MTCDLRLTCFCLQVECNVPGSASQRAPLLAAMRWQAEAVDPACPSPCTCQLYHFSVLRPDTPPAYTVLGNTTLH